MSAYGAGGRPAAGNTVDVGWLIGQFVASVPGTTHAVIVSLDGLQVAAAGDVDRDLGDQLAALTAGLLSMANQGGVFLGLGGTEHLTVRYATGPLLMMRAGETAGLAVAAAAGADLRVIAYQMTQFVGGVGHVLTPQMRTDLHATGV